MERLTQRDMDFLRFAGRQRGVRPKHIEARFDVSRATAYRRLEGLTGQGLLNGFDRISSRGRVFAASREGLAAAGLSLRPTKPTIKDLPHEEAMTEVVCNLERQGINCLTERELIARNRFERDGRYEFELMAERNHRRRQHRPDIVCEIPKVEKFIAIEVELTPKNVDLWRDILGAFRRRVNVDGFIGVLYVAGPSARSSRLKELAEEAGLGNRFQLRLTSDANLFGGLAAIADADVGSRTQAAA